jgi:hypothetical protein
MTSVPGYESGREYWVALTVDPTHEVRAYLVAVFQAADGAPYALRFRQGLRDWVVAVSAVLLSPVD